MSKKEIKITPPKGYEIDEENSSFDCIKFKPIKKEKKLTYKDVAKKLFLHNNSYWADCFGNITPVGSNPHPTWNDCTSSKQAQKLIAINKLMNVAKYLNGDWKPNWKNADENKWYIGERKDIYIDSAARFNCKICYFKTRELAKQAIEILGEDTIRLALSTDW